MKCFGEFYGEKAQGHYAMLKNMLLRGSVQVLNIPYVDPFYARMVRLDLVGEGRGSTISYYVEFVEARR